MSIRNRLRDASAFYTQMAVVATFTSKIKKASRLVKHLYGLLIEEIFLTLKILYICDYDIGKKSH